MNRGPVRSNDHISLAKFKSPANKTDANDYPVPTRRDIQYRDYLSINPDSHVDYLLKQMLIADITEGYNMPRLQAPSKASSKTIPSTYSTRSVTNRDKETDVSLTKMAETAGAACQTEETFLLPPPPATELEESDKIISEEQKKDPGAVINALNQIHFLVRNNQRALLSQGSQSETQLTQLNTCINDIKLGIGEAQQKLEEHDRELKSLKDKKASKSDLKSLEQTVASLKKSFDMKFEQSEKERAALASTIYKQKEELQHMSLEIKRLEFDHMELKERVNVLEIANKHLTLTIDNIPEDKKLKPAEAIIQRINTDTAVELSNDLILAAHRVGKFKPKAKQPRQIKFIVRDEKARESILASRGKLKQNTDKTSIWINESYPEEYRRRKAIMRDLVKRINSEGNYKASIESGGIKLDDCVYMPDQFHELPASCHPENVQSVETENKGLAFCGQWIYLSNMYQCQFEYQGTRYHSSEQCFQHHKALAHGKTHKAARILLTKNPFVCKRLGESFSDNKEWIDSREDTLYDILKCKFVQNEGILERLRETGDQKLFEATKSIVWGIGASLKSQETKEETGQGDNVLGKLLEKLRTELK